MHLAGFVNIVGRPNAGKSTLMNVLVGERMSIITSKPQTTRHRIIGILNEENYQIVFSDTPGFIQKPAYRMQKAMNSSVHDAFEDADVMLFMVDGADPQTALDETLLENIKKVEYPIFLILNKVDLLKEEQIKEKIEFWNGLYPFKESFTISALKKTNTEGLLKSILQYLPESEPYYPKDQLTDRPERFFIAEIIREKIFLNYRQEVPYSCEVVVESFKEQEERNFVKIQAMIYVSRQSQKPILIGDKGSGIKKLGIDARMDIEKFLEKKVYLELHVKVREDWRDNELFLKSFGYER